MGGPNLIQVPAAREIVAPECPSLVMNGRAQALLTWKAEKWPTESGGEQCQAVEGSTTFGSQRQTTPGNPLLCDYCVDKGAEKSRMV